MESDVQFTFRNKEFSCSAVIDWSDYPYYIFTILTDKELIREFGDEITIKTNGETLLPKRDDCPVLTEIREAIFAAIKATSDFMAVKEKMVGQLPPVYSLGEARRLNYRIIHFTKQVVLSDRAS